MPSFEDLPAIATSCVLSYVASSDWLSFRAASLFCYQTVHDTTNVWHSSDRTYAPNVPGSGGGGASGSADPTSANNGGEGEALWRLALARDYRFEGGMASDECLQSIHSPGFAPNDDDDVPFLSTGNMFIAPNAFTSWKHWRKIDLRLNDSRLGVPSTLSGPFFLRAGYMWQKIEDWCGRSGEYGRKIKASLSPGRPLYPNTSNANLSALQAVYAFYAGQYDDIDSQPTGLFGGFQAYDVISNTRWKVPWAMPATDDVVIIAQCSMKVIILRSSTGQVYSISRQYPQLVATPCPGGIQRRTVSGTKINELPVNIEDGKDSLLRWFEEHAHRLHQNYYAVGFLDPHYMDDDADAMRSLLKFPTANDTANCSRAVTRGVEIVASAIFAEEMGMFVYSIRMRLLTPDDGDSYVSPEQRGFDACQLVSRHWKISKLKANRPPVIDEVRGEGVIGCFPILCEGEYVRVFSDMQHRGRERGAFSYQSCTEAECPGAIEGYLQFRPDWGDGRPSGEIFNARVDPFPLTFSHFLY